jgi:hypothetical protein
MTEWGKPIRRYPGMDFSTKKTSQQEKTVTTILVLMVVLAVVVKVDFSHLVSRLFFVQLKRRNQGIRLRLLERGLR